MVDQVVFCDPELKEQHIVVNAHILPSTLDDKFPLSSNDFFVHNVVFCSVMAVYVLIMLLLFSEYSKTCGGLVNLTNLS